MDATEREFIQTFKTFLDRINEEPRPVGRTELGTALADYLGTEVEKLPLVIETVPDHRLVDADVALAALAEADPDSRLIGVNGGQFKLHEDLTALLVHSHFAFGPGPVDYVERATGPTTQRQIVGFGIRLFRFQGEAVAVLQRSARRDRGMDQAQIEVLSPSPDVAAALLVELRRLMRERSVVRGQVVSFASHEWGEQAGGMTFLPRPTVADVDVVLPEGTLHRIVSHVVEIGRHRDALRSAGQHLKRGVLLYGPPGTGKTLTVRHLIGRSTDATVVLLTGPAISMIGTATELARALQPAIVVIEDIDLIASDRDSYGPQPLLFSLLDALDGLDGDADVCFVMTTNRVEALERALTQRPGRVDLAVPVPLPDAIARSRLFALYAQGLPLSEAAVAAAAERSEGMTASFAKELMRRVVLRAAERGELPSDDDLEAALDQLLSSQEDLTRSLLGAASGWFDDGEGDDDGMEDDGDESFGPVPGMMPGMPPNVARAVMRMGGMPRRYRG